MLLKTESKRKTINIGIQILRMIFSFNIVVFHCIAKKYQYQNKLIYFISVKAVSYYVPTFFLISFYFSYNTFISRNIIKWKERLLRISIPYIIWPSVCWIKYCIINFLKGTKDTNKYRDLFHQLLLGKPILPVFWYQFCLILWTILFIIIIISFKKLYRYIMTCLFIIILCLNYFQITDWLLQNNSIFYAISVYDLFYRNIFMFSGFFFGCFALLDKKISLKLNIGLISFLGLIFLKYFNKGKKLSYICTQFIINIIFIFSSLFPFDLIKNKIFIHIINQITSYTGGIYYLHYEIKLRTFSNIYMIKKANFMSCIIIYFICYIFCFLSFKIFKNTKLKYLFI